VIFLREATSRHVAICSQLSGSAPNLIQINGTAVIAVAQAGGKDLYSEPHHRNRSSQLHRCLESMEHAVRLPNVAGAR
jgi:hypothetical protein